MCGIWMSVKFPPDPARIELVRHRGPDGHGWKVFDSTQGPVALGHRRLAIIDTSDAGLQPMADASGRYWLVFNGEIYNYLELRAELQQLGQVFRSQSDSEVLLAAYARWGEATLHRLIGMFAFVIWDTEQQRAFVARDRFGVKPLYYLASEHGVAFASEIKQLRGLPGERGRMNLARVHDYLTSGILDHTAETMFAGIRQLRPGECAVVDLAHPLPRGSLPVRRWYRLPPPGTIELSEAEAGENFRRLLTDAVRIHLRSDVAVGSCLSGGLDSSSIVCLMADLLGETRQIHTVSACYAEKAANERPFVEAVVERVDCIPHYVYPRPEDVLGWAERITWHQDEPYISTSQFAQWCVFDATRRAGLKVMLDGQGADEQLAGYHSGFSFHLADLIRRLRVGAAFHVVAERRRDHGVAIGEQLRRTAPRFLPPRIVQILRRRRDSAAWHDCLHSDAFAALDQSRSAFDTALAASGLDAVRDLGELCVALVEGANLTMLLHWEDRNSMAHSVEARVPFLDHRLVEFAIALGASHKIHGAETKRVLRRGMAEILPDCVLNRRDKLGFPTPEEAWFRGPLRAAVGAGVEDTLAAYPGLLNPAGARRVASDMLEGRSRVDSMLWRIINVGIWGKQFDLAA